MYRAIVSFIKDDMPSNLISKEGSGSDVKIWASQLMDLLSFTEGIKNIQLKIEIIETTHAPRPKFLRFRVED